MAVDAGRYAQSGAWSAQAQPFFFSDYPARPQLCSLCIVAAVELEVVFWVGVIEGQVLLTHRPGSGVMGCGAKRSEDLDGCQSSNFWGRKRQASSRTVTSAKGAIPPRSIRKNFSPGSSFRPWASSMRPAGTPIELPGRNLTRQTPLAAAGVTRIRTARNGRSKPAGCNRWGG